MEVEISTEAKDKRFNRMVAITVVVLSIFMGLSQVKDGNIVQAMQQAQSSAVDRWGEYQATKTKQHIDETALAQIEALSLIGGGKAAQASAPEIARLKAEIAKYKAEIPQLRDQAKGFEDQYNALNVHDDQFDASDALISIAVSMAAVAALVEVAGALYGAWVFGAGGIIMGLAGFLGWSLHSDLMAKILS